MDASLSNEYYYCHSCKINVKPYEVSVQSVSCPKCKGGFVEMMSKEMPRLSAYEDWCACGAGNLSDSSDESLSSSSPRVVWDLFETQHVDDFIDLANGSNTDSSDWETESSPDGSDDYVTPQLSLERLELLVGDDRRLAISGGSTRETRGDPGQIDTSLEGVNISISTSHGTSSPPRLRFGDVNDYAWGPNGMDDVISELMRETDDMGPPPARKSTIDGLPTISVRQYHVDKKHECSVCMESFHLNDPAKQLPCEHIFHVSCIDPWLVLRNTCPVCRKEVESEGPCCSHSSASSNSYSSQSSC